MPEPGALSLSWFRSRQPEEMLMASKSVFELLNLPKPDSTLR